MIFIVGKALNQIRLSPAFPPLSSIRGKSVYNESNGRPNLAMLHAAFKGQGRAQAGSPHNAGHLVS
jgi:hypothetical protein